MSHQHTIAKEKNLTGIGLHTGQKVTATFKPAEPDTGIVFIRTDIAGNPEIKACVENLLMPATSPRCSVLEKNGVQIQTLEHVMAALSGLGIDNIIIEINGVEVPGMDGSCMDFMQVLSEAGVREQDKPRSYFSIKEPIFVEDGNSTLIALPADDFRISYTLSYEHPLLKTKFLEVKITPDVFKSDIAKARTFCLDSEVDELKKHGFGKGANHENTVVVGGDGVLKTKLRYEDEFVRHKILDIIGDLNLFGMPIKGHIIALKSGHMHNVKLLKKIDQQKQKFSPPQQISIKYELPAGQQMDINEIKKILPHREPFLFVDRILSLERGKKCVGIKNVTINDYFFKGHFPEMPVMPGVLIVEAMAQVGGIMMLAAEENRGKIAFFMTINNVKFRKPVVPGDQLVFEVEAVKIKSRSGQVRGQALVDGKVVAEAEFVVVLGGDA
ncbi:MAG: bifunctional UDP-3-O-[3-hydroxymyristoyl] N-acetylglucosamine deacetylase/3-hydroxyacyl-ACP dehydratase [Candidatus Omnitrophica bacterium]|nr:bifunctional UDP-3-O-[3-hydroxymyristoyl] N-acetylglucosamine deacetylase/3-hydroxyacyl-ACP dehydratase [Candidatus Omnitrophota bacterium]